MRALIPKVFNSFCTTSSKIVTVNFDEMKKTAKIRLNNPKKRNTLSSEAITMLK
jgi:enoyl-CoA hydratase/carnithine racemase